AGRDPVVPGHPGVDLEHVVAEVGDHVVRVGHDGHDLSRRAAGGPPSRESMPPVQLSANVRITIPDLGLGPNEVDLRGTIRSCAATAYTLAADIGEHRTAVRPGASSAAWMAAAGSCSTLTVASSSRIRQTRSISRSCSTAPARCR